MVAGPALGRVRRVAPNIAYHVKALERLGLVELAAVAPQRGALEHFYKLKA